MITYAYILMGFAALGLLLNLAMKKPVEAIACIFGFAISLPIYGRVLGWW